uniref:Small ribosomal subunit protein uS14c n=1 Tax=Hildenbrandia rivularis TaxID=135206 RepID=A0A1C9CFC2_9FLOR|nr:ribosomal protein S14 [Hildenbrandia rivularis]AOM67065.1 ribosomal protein S14 [Hildenbrandia rivularis]
MAKQSMIQREQKRRSLVDRYEKKRKIIKQKIKHTQSITERLLIQEELQKLPRNSSRCRLRNRCWLTGRSRGYYRDFGLSRHVLREMARECFLPGVTKSSW